MNNYDDDNFESIAVIGMACKFPGADTYQEFWKNILEKRESITQYTYEELLDAGVAPDLLNNPNYVRARGDINKMDAFDAPFFNFSPKDAALMDPQHRIALECAWHALEDSGYDAARFYGNIGVFAGESMNSYLLLNVFPFLNQTYTSVATLQAAIGNDKDSLTSMIAYAIGLTGPAITIQSSSSTSLTAISVACQSLLNYQCDMALAGGVSIGVPQKNGYLYQEGGILSSDGHCKPFDDTSDGFVSGNGCGMVVLKRLSEAKKDNDHIYAVVKGFAINNDGRNKVSYSAPSVVSQSEVITEAQEMSDIDINTIRYIEAHGTGTKMGDPIEVEALKLAFERKTKMKEYCAIGSVKGNIGHLDSAAGVAGFIKTCLAIYNRILPPSINFKTPNKKIDFGNSPFYVNTSCYKWPKDSPICRAGVTSLGMGGTNVHIVLEEAERQKDDKPNTLSKQIFVLSAKSEISLKKALKSIAVFINKHPEVNLKQLAYTLQMGRRELPMRIAFPFHTRQELLSSIDLLLKQDLIGQSTADAVQVVFLFSGQGTQYVGMGRILYNEIQEFRRHVDICEKILYENHHEGVLQYILDYETKDAGANRLNGTDQIAIFVIEYALAQTLITLGIHPVMAIGHSIGEYSAACVSGGIQLRDALQMVVCRGIHMAKMKEGNMLAVRSSVKEIKNYLVDGVSIAAINSQSQIVLSGECDVLDCICKQIKKNGIYCKYLDTQQAFHSSLMKDAADQYKTEIKNIQYHEFSFPVISTVNGKPMTKESVSADYWGKQIIEPVRFYDAARQISNLSNPVVFEIGASHTLCNLIKQMNFEKMPVTISTLPPAIESDKSAEIFHNAISVAWIHKIPIDWLKLHNENKIGRISLPVYPFDEKKYWINATDNTKKKHENKTSEIHKAVDNTKKEYNYQEIYNFIKLVWTEILMNQDIDKEDNFFHIGGDSITLIQLFDKINLKFPNILRVSDLFVNFTISSQAKLLFDRLMVYSPKMDSSLESIIDAVSDGKLDIELAINKLTD